MLDKKIHLPKSEQPIDAVDLFDDVMRDLPLEGCRVEPHPLTGRLEFVAPEGQIFEAGGDFQIELETNDGSHLMNPPTYSYSLLSRKRLEHPEWYKDSDSIYYDWDPPVNFRGSRLAISIGGVAYGQVIYPSTLEAMESNNLDVQVSVVGPIDAESWPTPGEYVWEDPPGSGMYRGDFYPGRNHDIFWRLEEAVGSPKTMPIEIVTDDSSVMPLKLEVGHNQRDDNWIWMPHGPGITTDMLDAVFQKEIPVEQKLAYMRQRRLEGMPLGDDPLRHLKLVTEDGEQELPMLEILAEQVEQGRRLNPRSFAEAQEMWNERDRQRLREERAQRLKGTLAVITENGQLAQLVQAHASEDWLEKELDRLSRFDLMRF